MRVFLSTAALVSLAACASVPRAVDVGDVARADTGLEEVYTASVLDRGVQVRAASNGCTTKDSFDVTVEEEGSEGGAPRQVVSFVRKRPDPCPGFEPNGVLLFYSRDELRLADDATVTIANPLGSPRRQP
jgi:hypothetical protein